jgi:hypothetical protein
LDDLFLITTSRHEDGIASFPEEVASGRESQIESLLRSSFLWLSNQPKPIRDFHSSPDFFSQI